MRNTGLLFVNRNRQINSASIFTGLVANNEKRETRRQEQQFVTLRQKT